MGKLKSKKRSISPLDLASGRLGGIAIAAAIASHIKQPNCNSMPNIAHNIVRAVTVAYYPTTCRTACAAATLVQQPTMCDAAYADTATL